MPQPVTELVPFRSEPGSYHVTGARLEQRLAEVEADAPGEREGIFGPDSMSWRINRESALFLAAGRATLLQMAHPWVARALEEHSTTLQDPIKRFHNTFRVVYAMVFGTRSDALGAARHLHDLHTKIRGQLSEGAGPYPPGASYRASDAAALRWVFTTLVDSAVVAYELVLPPLSMAEREQYYREGVRWAGLFGIDPEMLPPDWPSFMEYAQEMWGYDVLTVTPLARHMGHRILAGAGSWIRPPFWYRALTTEMLPDRIRCGYELQYGSREQRAAARARRWLPRIYPRLPGWMRFVGPYREAQARMAGKQPPWTAAWSTRFWTGA